MTPLDWDAETYDSAAAPVHTMGAAILDELELRGDETVLDAGCGSGVVTVQLLERLPNGRVIAVDGSPRMIDVAREVLDPARTELIVADLQELELDRVADVAFSSATFHWVPDHARLFTRLHAALRPGGRLRAQFGGAGNCAEIGAVLAEVTAREPFSEYVAGWNPWTFDPPETSAAHASAAGFEDVKAWPQAIDLVFDDADGYLRSTQLGTHLERLPPEHHDAFAGAVAERLPDPLTVHYVRTNLSARRPD